MRLITLFRNLFRCCGVPMCRAQGRNSCNTARLDGDLELKHQRVRISDGSRRRIGGRIGARNDDDAVFAMSVDGDECQARRTGGIKLHGADVDSEAFQRLTQPDAFGIVAHSAGHLACPEELCGGSGLVGAFAAEAADGAAAEHGLPGTG